MELHQQLLSKAFGIWWSWAAERRLDSLDTLDVLQAIRKRMWRLDEVGRSEKSPG